MTRDSYLFDSGSYRRQRVKYQVPVNKKELKFKDFILVFHEMLKLRFLFYFWELINVAGRVFMSILYDS